MRIRRSHCARFVPHAGVARALIAKLTHEVDVSVTHHAIRVSIATVDFLG